MATTPTTRVTSLARSHRLDIDTATYPAVQYQLLYGLEDLKLIEDPTVEADDEYTDDGAMRETNTGYGWRLEGKLAYSTNLAESAIDPVHAFLRSKFKGHRAGRVQQYEFGVRFYHREGLDSGYECEGRVYIKQWGLPGGKGRDVIDIVLQGQGSLADITNPAGSLTPVVTGLSPATGAAAGGELINIYGTHFATATDVDFASDAADFVIVNDSHIVAIAPAHAAGTVQVKVTNPTGASANVAADDYVYTA